MNFRKNYINFREKLHKFQEKLNFQKIYMEK